MNKLIIMILCISSFYSCKEEKKPESIKIKGEWLVYKAERNNHPTSTFDGAYFNFNDTIMITNYQGEEIRSSYYLNQNVLIQSDPENLQYQLESNHSDTVLLSTELHGSKFKFLLIRRK